MRYLGAYVALAIAAIVPAAELRAADVRIANRVPGAGCHLSIKGPIEIGDLKKVSSALRELDREFTRRLADASLGELTSVRNPGLCLDSPGGSYPEGLRIAELLITPGDHLRTGVMTTVDPGRECLSACALIFMAGQFIDRGGERSPARFLDVRGKLGFHAPFIPATAIPDKQYSREELAAAHASAIKSLQAAIQLFSFNISEQAGGTKARPWVRPSLFAEMLARSSHEIFLIDTVGKAGRWDIQLGGVRPPSSLNSDRLKRACANFLAWQDDMEALGDQTPVEVVPKGHPDYPQNLMGAGISVFRFIYTRREVLCAVTPRTEPDPQRPWMALPGGKTLGLQISLFNGGQRYDHPVDFPTWAAENSDLPIAKLPTAR